MTRIELAVSWPPFLGISKSGVITGNNDMERQLNGIDLQKRWNPWGIRLSQILKFISEGELPAYWYDDRRIADKKKVVKKIKVLGEIIHTLRIENPNLKDSEIESIAFKKGQKKYPNLPWGSPEKYHYTHLTPPKNMETCSHKELYRVEKMIENVKNVFVYKESDVIEFEKHFSFRQKNDSEGQINPSQEKATEGEIPPAIKQDSLGDLYCLMLKYSADLNVFYKGLKIYIRDNIKNGDIKEDATHDTIKEVYDERKNLERFKYMTLDNALKGVYRGDNPSMNIKMPILMDMIKTRDIDIYIKHEDLFRKDLIYPHYTKIGKIKK